MKLLLVTSRFPFGPKESFLSEEIAQLSNAFDIVVLPALPTRESLQVPALKDRAARLPLLSMRVLRQAFAEAFRRPRETARTFASVVRAPKAIHAKLKNALIFPTALAAARVARENRIEHVHACWLATPSTIAYVVSRLCGIPWSATGHRYDLVDFNVRTTGTQHAGFFPTARFVRTISKQGADRIASAFAGQGPAVHVIHLGVALAPLATRPERTSGALHLLCAANLERVKGHEILLDALRRASQHATIRCTFAGDGTLRAKLEAKARALGIDRIVTFEGVVAHDRLLERISSGEFGAAILASLDEGPAEREGIPVFLMEAMARGLPVVATRSGAVCELVNASNGILCPPGDSRALADAIERLARDNALQDILGRAGRRTVAEKFNVIETSRRLIAMISPDFERTLGRKAQVAAGARARIRTVSRGSIDRDSARLQS